jgi:hypothetical protein
MKRRVAVVSSCCPPLPGRPVTGGGLRTAQLVETLRGAGHAVVLLVERAALPPVVPEGITAFDVDELPAAIKKARPSVVVVEQWALATHLGDIDKPLVVDLHGSLLLENVYRRGDVDYTLDAGAKLEALHRADLLLTPAPAQLHHFASWATLAGFDPRELPLALLPLALPGAPTERSTKKPPLRVVYGGARWPWINSLEALQTASEAMTSLDGATLDVFTYDPPRHGLPLEEDLGTWAEVDAALTDAPGVTQHVGVGQDVYAAFLRGEATVALDLWEPNAERLLAATTRTGEFLHAGLPVITVAGSAWAEELVMTGAGWALPPGDDDALRALLTDLCKHPSKIAAASRAAVALMSGAHALGAAGTSLVDFVLSPHRPPRSMATLVDAIVAVRQAHLDETLRSEQAAHEDEHARLVAAHRAEVAELRASNAAETTDLTRRHEALTTELREAHRADVDRMTAEGRAATEAQASRDAEATAALTEQHRAEVRTLTDENRAELDAVVAEHRAQADALAAASREQLTQAAAERKAEVEEVVAEHRAQADALAAASKEQLTQAAAERKAEVETMVSRVAEERTDIELRHRADLAEAVAGHRVAMEDARTAIERSASELETAVDEHRAQMEAADAEHRSEMASESARHRTEIEEAVGSWQARLDQATDRARSDRHQARESRTRLEVELRADLARTEERARAREQDVARTQTELDSVRHELERTRAELTESRATLAARLRGRLERVDPLDALPGRAKPALHLAKLWVEHALDRSTRGPGPGEG